VEFLLAVGVLLLVVVVVVVVQTLVGEVEMADAEVERHYVKVVDQEG
jgi:hypothetical protein